MYDTPPSSPTARQLLPSAPRKPHAHDLIREAQHEAAVWPVSPDVWIDSYNPPRSSSDNKLPKRVSSFDRVIMSQSSSIVIRTNVNRTHYIKIGMNPDNNSPFHEIPQLKTNLDCMYTSLIEQYGGDTHATLRAMRVPESIIQCTYAHGHVQREVIVDGRPIKVVVAIEDVIQGVVMNKRQIVGTVSKTNDVYALLYASYNNFFGSTDCRACAYHERACNRVLDQLTSTAGMKRAIDTNPDNIFVLALEDNTIVLMICDLGIPNEVIFKDRPLLTPSHAHFRVDINQ